MSGRRAMLPVLVLASLSLATAAIAVPDNIGVAPFEAIAAKGHAVPDVAARLAQRFGTQGVAKVVGPTELDAEPISEPTAKQVRQWGQAAGVDQLVVGKVFRLGNTLSVDARLMDVASGRPVGPRFVEEAARPEDLGKTIDALATQLLERADSGRRPDARAVASAPGVAAAPAASAPAASTTRSAGSSANTPISIQSDSLEVREGPPKMLVFSGSVRAKQDDLLVHSSRLEASYPKGRSQPTQLVATGKVRLEQQDRIAHCKKAVYYRDDRRVVCTGNARVDQSCDSVRGDTITFYLDRETLKVEGSADVQMLDDPSCQGGG